jgi:hypothetical protein
MTAMRRTVLPLVVLLCTGPSPTARAADGPDVTEFIEKNVRPTLLESCVRCRGPERHHGGLWLASRTAALAGGEGSPILIPGQPDKSRLIQ